VFKLQIIKDLMDKTEVKKLKALLTHWIEHTEEHSDEFEEWAQKFNSSRFSEIYINMLSASKGMGSVRDYLTIALKELDKLDI
jgi:hypothetical protein